MRCISSVSYIKPQLISKVIELLNGCISSVSYIKPQLIGSTCLCLVVVYRPFPTSNHNMLIIFPKFSNVVYRPFPTSNHNCHSLLLYLSSVVYRPFPTSNHNLVGGAVGSFLLYIVRFLHQTTTCRCHHRCPSRCISSVSYIKPQLGVSIVFTLQGCISSVSYIKPQHHVLAFLRRQGCISSVSYIKPQPFADTFGRYARCISSVSYIKPQRASFPGSPSPVVYRPFPTSNHN